MSGSDKLLPVVAASYNMSFAADLNNHNLGSEKHRSFTNKEQKKTQSLQLIKKTNICSFKI